MFNFLSYFAGGTVYSAILLSLLIALCAMLLEDFAIVVVGILAADGLILVPVAFFSLYLGIFVGDLVLYSIGSFARTHKRLANYIDHDFTAPFRSWLERRYSFNIFSGHFIPGMRLTTYVASGFFHSPFRTYISMAIAGGLLLETILFSFSYWLGEFTSQLVGQVRWGIAFAFLLILFIIGKYNVKLYRTKKDVSVNNTYE